MKAKKLSALLVTLCAAAMLMAAPTAAADTLIDPMLILSPETSLTVSVDGAVSAALSDTVPYGEALTLTAPEVADKTFQYWTNGEGTVISYSNTLNLTMYANTTVNAVYGESAEAAQPVAAFLNVTRTDGEIIFNTIASGIRYSTTKSTLNDLKGDDNVTVVTASSSPNWTLTLTPTDANTVYYAVAYTEGSETTYSAVKVVQLSELNYGVSMVTNLGDIDLSQISAEFCVVTFNANGGNGVMEPQGVVKGAATALNANTFTREGYTFNGWSTTPTGSVTYTDGQTVTLSANTTLYAKWETGGGSGGSGNGSSSGGGNGGNTTYAPTISETKNGTVTVNPKSASSGTKVTITATPNEGYEVGTVSVKDATGKALEVTKNADGTYTFTQPAGKVTIDVTFVEENILDGFTDVDASAWYADAVKWALKNGVMSGYGNGLFGPNDTASRAMMAQILWNMECKCQ